MKQMPPAVRFDPGWRGAMFILQQAFPHTNDVWNHVDTIRYSISFERMIAGRGWSSTEFLLLKAAASIFDFEFDVKLYRLMNALDDRQMAVVFGALTVARGRSELSGSEQLQLVQKYQHCLSDGVRP